MNEKLVYVQSSNEVFVPDRIKRRVGVWRQRSLGEEKEMSLDDASTRDLGADLYQFCRPMVRRLSCVPAELGLANENTLRTCF